MCEEDITHNQSYRNLDHFDIHNKRASDLFKNLTETVVCGRTTVMVWRFYVLSFRYDVEYVPTQDVS